MEELVSVVMPTRNGSKTILRAINSVFNQTYQNIELIVVDDLSEDNTKQVVQELKNNRITLLSVDKHTTTSYARNIGISNAKGKYIAFLDDDDEWSNLKVTKQVEFLVKNPNFKAVITDYILKIGDKSNYYKTNSSDYTKDILLMNKKLAAGSNILALKSEVDKVNGFDDRFVGHQDLEFLIRLDQENKVGHVNGFLLTVNGRGGRNASDTDKLLNIKKLFLTKFEPIISKYPEKIQKRIYARHWLQIARGYVSEGNNLLAKKFLKESLEYTFLWSPKYYILPFETYLYFSFHYVKNLLLRKPK